MRLTTGMAMLCASATMIGTALAKDVIVEDFESKPELFVYKGKERGADFKISKAPKRKGLAARAGWADEHYRYNEYRLKDVVPLPQFTKELKGSVSVWLLAGEGNRAERNISLRLKDARGEVFQYRSVINGPLEGDWRKYTFDLSPENVRDTWGSNVDGKFDLPASLLGFALDYDPKVKGAGCIYIDDISVDAIGEERVETKKQVWRFDRTEKWNFHGLKADDKVTKKEGSLTVSLPDKTRFTRLLRRKDSLKTVPGITRFELDLNCKSGSASVRIKLKSPEGPTLASTLIPLKSGRSRLFWDYPKDFGGKIVGDGRYYLECIEVERPDTSKPLELEFTKGTMYQSLSPTEAIEVGLETGNPIHVLKPGQEKQLSLKLRNNALTSISFQLKGTLENFFHERVSVSEGFVLAPQSETTWQCPALPREKGIWWFNYRLTANDSTTTGRRSFAYMQPAGPTPGKADGFLFGVCTHTERWCEEDHDLEVLTAAMCGVKIVRTGVGWGGFEREQGKWTFEAQDRLVEQYGKQGMELQPLFGFTPRWAAPESTRNSRNWTDWNRAVPDMAAWRKYIHTVVKRYTGKIRYWEVWNEPDLNGFFRGNADDYSKMLKAAYEEVKAANPDAIVMTGGFASLLPHPGKKDPEFHDKVVLSCEDYFDVHAMHQHGPFDSFRKCVDEKLMPLRSKMKKHKPLYFNETAIHSLGDTQRAQAQVLVKKVLFAVARGAIGYNWYDLRDDGYDPNDAEHHFGLVTNDFYPKAAYPAYNTLIATFRGKQFRHQLDLGDGRWAFVYGNASQQVIVAWNEANGDADEHVVLKTDAKSALAVDMMGNTSDVQIDQGLVVLKVSPTPSYMILDNSVELPEVKGRLIGANALGALVPGRKSKLELEVYNPFGEKARICLDLYAPAGITTGQVSREVTVAGHEKKKVRLELELQPDQTSLGDRATLKLFYKVVGSSWQGRVPITLDVARLISPSLTNGPDFVIDKREQMMNICENDPNSAHLTWQGPKDVSASIRLGQRPGKLLLKVDVTDDIHKQAFKGPFVWKGDNIQFALQIPGQGGWWEAGLSRLDDGTSEVFTWSKPSGFEDPSKSVQLQTRKTDKGVEYVAELPYKAFGLSDEILRQGVRFNLVVNDNDGDVREGWIRIAPGIAETKNPDLFPSLVFDIP